MNKPREERQASRGRRFLRIAGIVCIAGLLGLSLCALIWYVVLAHQIRSRLDAVRTLKVGEAKGAAVVGIAKRFGATAHIEVIVGPLPGGVDIRHVPVPLERCATDDCIVDIPPPGLSGGNLLRLLPLKMDRPGIQQSAGILLRQWVITSGMAQIQITVKKGTASKVQLWAGCLTEPEVENDIDISVTAEPPSKSPWDVQFWDAVSSGDIVHKAKHLTVEATPAADQGQLSRAFDLNARCFMLGAHCDSCEMLPQVCEDYANGKWFYFELPAERLAALKAKVNGLVLGADRESVLAAVDSIGFPQDSRAADDSGYQVTYFEKKWRRERNESTRDVRVVTFVFDDEDRLVKVVSYVDGIQSRR